MAQNMDTPLVELSVDLIIYCRPSHCPMLLLLNFTIATGLSPRTLLNLSWHDQPDQTYKSRNKMILLNVHTSCPCNPPYHFAMATALCSMFVVFGQTCTFLQKGLQPYQ
jgi:hypothetical protein